MKADPLTLILDRNFEINKIFYMISGNEITLMETIRDLLIKKSKEKNSADIKKIKSTKEIEKAVGLFNKNSLYVLSEVKDIENKHLDILMKTNYVYILLKAYLGIFWRKFNFCVQRKCVFILNRIQGALFRTFS